MRKSQIRCLSRLQYNKDRLTSFLYLYCTPRQHSKIHSSVNSVLTQKELFPASVGIWLSKGYKIAAITLLLSKFSDPLS